MFNGSGSEEVRLHRNLIVIAVAFANNEGMLSSDINMLVGSDVVM
jgi:hypothetical protein